jgi:hypothetical protein
LHRGSSIFRRRQVAVAIIQQVYGNRYLNQERGNRAAPDRFHPRYWGLTLLLRCLQGIVHSDALRPGETVLDYGCGNKPYEALFRTKFRQYVGADFAARTRERRLRTLDASA